MPPRGELQEETTLEMESHGARLLTGWLLLLSWVSWQVSRTSWVAGEQPHYGIWLQDREFGLSAFLLVQVEGRGFICLPKEKVI